MIEKVIRLDPALGKERDDDQGAPTDVARLVAQVSAATRPSFTDLEQRLLLGAYPILHESAKGMPPSDWILRPQLTLLANDLTDVEELQRLAAQVTAIQERRREERRSRGERGFLPYLYIVGGGAEFSERYPRRSMEAEELRDGLFREGAVLLEKPANGSEESIRRYMEQLLRPGKPASVGVQKDTK